MTRSLKEPAQVRTWTGSILRFRPRSRNRMTKTAGPGTPRPAGGRLHVVVRDEAPSAVCQRDAVAETHVFVGDDIGLIDFKPIGCWYDRSGLNAGESVDDGFRDEVSFVSL